MDTVDRQILDLMQNNFPIVPEPFRLLGGRLGMSEDEVIQRTVRLKEDGLIRRIGGSFDSKKMGYTSTLCAMQVCQDKIEETVQVINSYHEVTHNYLRRHEFNIWFTVIAESEEKIGEIIEEIKQKTGQSRLINLPAVRVFKIDVNFAMNKQMSGG